MEVIRDMRVIKILFTAHLAALVLGLGSLLIISSHPEIWNTSPIGVAIFENVLRFAGTLHVLFGAATMFLFGWLFVGPRKTLVFFIAATMISLSMELFGTSIGFPFGISLSITYPGIKVAGFVPYSILLSWFYMGFTSYLVASKLVALLKWPRQTLWSLLLGTYFLITWDLVLNSAIDGQHLAAQAETWQLYGAYFGMPMRNLLGWTLNGLLFLSVARLLWRSNVEQKRVAAWLPAGVYSANTGFALALNLGLGLWFPLLLSAFFVLLPESLILLPRDAKNSARIGRLRMGISLFLWEFMRVGTLFFARRKVTIDAEGLEHIPTSGPTMIAVRHFHWFYDGYALVRTIRRPLHTVVALDWMQSSSLRLVVEYACSLADWPVVLRSEQFRQHADDAHWAFDANETRQYLRRVMLNAVRVLRSSSVLVIFPEGYPNIDIHDTPKADLGSFLPFRPGFAKMAELAEKDRHTQVAIIPTGLSYTQLPGKRWHITVRYGPPLRLSDFTSSEQLLLAVEERVHILSGVMPPPTSPATSS
jgi:uncharacterized membrane protein/1-acyl-sn-glycerol-3-phosphate acyltransferase